VSSDFPTVLGDGGRFLVERTVGRGAFGVVYAARDRRTGKLIALKLLHERDEAAKRSLEREFRVLAGLVHPNLVRLHEFLRDEGQCFFTMELVRGTDFVSFARSDARVERPAGRGLPMAFGQALHEGSVYSPCSPSGLQRLRKALVQLSSALETLHGAGIVHRDLRPENVRVTPEGRVVVLDYGLVARAAEDVEGDSTPEGRTSWVGTAAYMAPEQWDEQHPSAASDWYAVGVLLFQALTGALPFAGSAHEVFVRKRSVGAPRVSSLLAGVPRDLDQLSADLLEIDPARRPSGHDLHSRLRA
jgi:serine/threonine protein kinase